MNNLKRDQIRIFLERLTGESQLSLNEQISDLYRLQADILQLRTGTTVEAAVGIMAESGQSFLDRSFKKTAEVSRTPEALSMLQTSYEVYIRFMEFKLEDVLHISGIAKDRLVMTVAYRDGKLLFETMRSNLSRIFENHRLAFINTDAEGLVVSISPAIVADASRSKNKGGKPLADHWDDMWATLAFKLYTGEFHPKTQADIENEIKIWAINSDVPIGDTSARARARKLWQKIDADN